MTGAAHPKPALEAASSLSARLRVVRLIISICFLFAAVMLLRPAVRTFQRAAAAVDASALQLDNEESALLFQALELRRGAAIYRPITSEPYVAGTYPPVFIWINSWFADPAAPSFLSGRTVSIAATVVTSLILLAAVGVRTRSPFAAVAAPMIFLSSYEVFNWIAYYRVDMLAIALSSSGLMCMVLWRQSQFAKIASICLFALGVFTKQTCLTAPAAVVLSLLVEDWRTGVKYLGGFAAALMIPFVAITLLTDNQFAIHTIWYNMNRYNPRELVIWAHHLWTVHRWLLLSGLFATAASIAACRSIPSPQSHPIPTLTGVQLTARFRANPVPLYFFLSFLNFLAIAKAGTAENYLLEPILATAWMVSESFGRRTQIEIQDSDSTVLYGVSMQGFASLAGAVLLCLHGIHLTRPPLFEALFNLSRSGTPADRAAASEVQRLVRNEKKDTWCELGIFNLRSRRSLVFQPFIMSELVRQHRWDPSGFCHDIETHRFGLVVASQELKTASDSDVYCGPILDKFRKHYILAGCIDSGPLWKYYLYRPRAK